MSIRRYGNASAEDISIFEDHIGFALPEDYRKFLLEYNGGSARDYTFSVNALNENIPLNVLFGLSLDRRLDLNTWHNEYRKDLLPNSIIIGHDAGSGIIVLVNEPDDQGIYYWDHTLFFEQSSEKENIYIIANNFQAFIDGLKEPKSF